VSQVARDQRQQGEGAAFALVVGAHCHEHIFDRHDEHQRPEDQADDPEDVKPVDRQRVRPEEAFLHGVERRRADIAVDHADRTKHQLGQGLVRAVMDRQLLAGEHVVGSERGHGRSCGVPPHKDSMWIAPARSCHAR
jgi:hypothetical protein